MLPSTKVPAPKITLIEPLTKEVLSICRQPFATGSLAAGEEKKEAQKKGTRSRLVGYRFGQQAHRHNVCTQWLRYCVGMTCNLTFSFNYIRTNQYLPWITGGRRLPLASEDTLVLPIHAHKGFTFAGSKGVLLRCIVVRRLSQHRTH